jgi:hypothetical protein
MDEEGSFESRDRGVTEAEDERQKRRVELRDASMPGYELGSRGIELSRIFGIGSCRKGKKRV